MLKVLQKLPFSTNLSKNILVMDAGPLDILINDFPQECLDRDVSPAIGKSYLSVCEHSEQSILQQSVYRGVIMGRMRRLFVSIPTKFPAVNKYYNVHYLIDTGSPITTLTRRALCTLHQKKYDSQQEFTMTSSYQIGSQGLRIQCSNPDKQSESRPYHNVNLLGMDFFQKFQYFSLKNNMRKLEFILQLSKNIPKNWDKTNI